MKVIRIILREFTKFSTREKDPALKIVSDLAHPIRLHILNSVAEKRANSSLLAKQLGTTIQNLQRHISRLKKNGLIEVNNDGMLTISPIGRVALGQIPNLKFVSDNAAYFKTHSIEQLPYKSIQSIGFLGKSIYTDDLVSSWEIAKSIVENSSEFLYGLTNQLPPNFYDLAQKKIGEGVRFRGIYSKNFSDPVTKAHLKKLGWTKFLKKGLIEERFVENTPFYISISDKQAAVSFPHITSPLTGDPNSNFSSRDGKFRDWCMTLFYEYWKKGKPYDRKLKKV